jgi:hypothetical protein
MCTCTHGSDRHFLDYAGPGVQGGVLGRCLEKDCPCQHFTPVASSGIQILNPFQQGGA